MPLVTYQQAIDHLRVSGMEDAADIELKMNQATAIVLAYIKRPETDWTATTDATSPSVGSPASEPELALVQAAILMVLADLVRFRGDESVDWRESPESGATLKPAVRRLLHMIRTPTLA